ncbi:MAG: DNA-3-methyladenine glycosylase family protein [Acidimicrobiia bacterium]
MTAADVRAAADQLAERDPVMARLVAEHGPPRLAGHRRGPTRFEQLAEAIVYQQLAGRAAAAIWSRVRAVAPDAFEPPALLAAGHEALRAAGCSNAKAVALCDLAAKVAGGDVRLERIGRLGDDDVVAELTKVKGIGRWTAEMFLIFSLRRLDVWPVGDFGVRAGYAKAYGLATAPAPTELMSLGERFRPYRTVAAWYCWRATESMPPE